LKKAFYSSLFIHLVVFIFISITLPEIKTKEIDYISVEIIHEKIKKLEKIKEVEEVEKIKEIKKIIKVKEVKNIEINPAPPQKKPNILPKISESIKIAEKIDIKPKIPIKKPEIKIKNKIVKKINNANKTKNNDDIFDDMLKNLAEYQPNPVKPKQEIKTEAITKPARTNREIKRIQKSIINIIYKQIKENYTIPPAQDIIENKMVVQLRIYIRQDGTISRTLVKEESLKRAKSDSSYLPYVEAAQRAIRKVGKFKKLPQEEYDLWDIIDINFTPLKT